MNTESESDGEMIPAEQWVSSQGGWTLQKLVEAKQSDYSTARGDDVAVLDRLSAEYEALWVALELAKRYGVPKGW